MKAMAWRLLCDFLMEMFCVKSINVFADLMDQTSDATSARSS